MALQDVLAGIVEVNVNGKQVLAKGNWTYMVNPESWEMMAGADAVHGPKVMPLVAYIEGEITDRASLDLLEDLYSLGRNSDQDTVTLRLHNRKTILLRNAIFAGEGQVQTEEGNITVRFEGKAGEEVPAQ